MDLSFRGETGNRKQEMGNGKRELAFCIQFRASEVFLMIGKILSYLISSHLNPFDKDTADDRLTRWEMGNGR